MSKAQGALSKVGSVANSFFSGLSSATGLSNLFGSSVQQTSSKISDMISISAGLKIVETAFNAVSGSIDSAMNRIDVMEQFSRTMTVLTGSSDAANEALDSIRSTVTGTAYGLDVAASSVQSFVTSGKDIDVAANDIKGLANAVSFYGDGTNSTLQSVGDAWGKMATSGKVYSKDVQSLLNAGIPVWQIYADAVGMSVDDVQKATSAGEISALEFQEVLINAFEEGTEKFPAIANAAQEAGASWKGTLDNFKAYTTRGVVSIIEAIDTSLSALDLPEMRDLIKSFGLEVEESLNLVANGLSTIIGNAGEDLQVLYQAFSSGNFELVGEKVGDVLSNVLTTINESLPKFVNSAVDIINSILQGFSSSQSGVFEAGIQIYKTILNGIREIIPNILPLVSEIANAFTQTFIEKQSLLFEIGIQLITAITEGIAENIDDIVDSFFDAIDRVLEVFSENLPKFLNAGAKIISSIIQGITDRIPNLSETSEETVQEFIESATSKFGEVLESGGELLGNLIDGIIQNLPFLIQTASDLVVSLLGKISEHLPEIIAKGNELLGSLILGIVQALPDLIKVAIQLVVDLVAAIYDNYPLILQTGMDILWELIKGIVSIVPDLLDAMIDIGGSIVTGVWEGIKAMGEWLTGKVKNFFGGIVDTAKGILGIHSPSTVFAWIGKMIDEGVGGGIENNMKTAIDSAANMAGSLYNAASEWIDNYKEDIGDLIAETNTFSPGNIDINAVQSSGYFGNASKVSGADSAGTIMQFEPGSITVQFNASDIKEIEDIIYIFENLKQESIAQNGLSWG